MAVSNRGLLAVVALIVATAVVGMVFLWPDAAPAGTEPVQQAQTTELVNAELVEVVESDASEMPGLLPGAVTVQISARLEDSGELVTFEMTDETGDTYAAGQAVRLAKITTDGQPAPTYFVSDFRRGPAMTVLLVTFLIAVVAFGRFQGARALLGLGLSLVVIVGFIVPAILSGRSPVAVALVGSLAIMVATLYLSHGLRPKTTAALVGTAGALALTVVLAAGFVAAASITGFASEEARLATYEVGGLSLRGLLLAGIIIGSLGVLDDVTISQSSTVFELRQADPSAPFGRLVRRALNVGRDHIAATINTLFLAYAGASLPLLILFVVGTDSVPTLLSSEIVAVEVVRTLVGSIGLIAAVPLTTLLAAAVAVGQPATSRRQPASAPRSDLDAANDQQDAEGDDEQWVQRLRDAYHIDRPRR